MEQLIFCYVAFADLPYWHGYVYVINIGKQIYFNDLINNGQYKKAEEYLLTNKFMSDFFGKELPPNLHVKFGGFSWSEYQKCFADACYQYLLNFYLRKNMLLEADQLRKSAKWWGDTYLLKAEYNDFANDWLKALTTSPFKSPSLSGDLIHQKMEDRGVHLFQSGILIIRDMDYINKSLNINGSEIEKIITDRSVSFVTKKQVPSLGMENGTFTFGLDNNFLAAGKLYRNHLEEVNYKNTEYTECA